MRSDELVTIAGKRGYGKTTAAKTLISKLARVVIWDPMNEADQVLPEGRPLCEYGGKIVNLGRHRNIGMGTITRRVALLNKTVVSQAQELILFHTFIPNDIRYLKEFIIGVDELRTLPKYRFKTYRM
jgi:DNA helicase HerA-like ATPase